MKIEDTTISKLAAIDAIYKCTDIYVNNLPIMIDKAEAYKAISELPSTQPEILACGEGELIARPEQWWIPCSERLPEEDHWLGGSGRQFSDEVMVSVANYDDEDIWIDISQTIDGQWALELPSHCEIIAWIPLPEPYTKRRGK